MSVPWCRERSVYNKKCVRGVLFCFATPREEQRFCFTESSYVFGLVVALFQ